MSVKYDLLPKRLQKDAKNYITRGTKPTGLLECVLANDLITTFRYYGKPETDACVRWVICECPLDAWGSYEKVRAWVKTFKRKMECPTCDHTMQQVCKMVFYCPRCGTLKEGDDKTVASIKTPWLIGRTIEYFNATQSIQGSPSVLPHAQDLFECLGKQHRRLRKQNKRQ